MIDSPLLIEDVNRARQALGESRRLAILGIKPEDHSAQPAFYVPRALVGMGWDIVPVPVYYPEVTHILGRPVYRSLATIPGDIDMVVVFRRSRDIPSHLPDIIAKKPRFAWFQLGIRNDEAAAQLAAAGIAVVQDRCTMVEARYIR
ncbi:MAG: CoA-binding protein [Longimicrobiales bacterium]